MNIKQVKEIITQDEARQFAVDWQIAVGEEQDISYSELCEWGEVFNELAIKFDLVDEFKENGII